MSKALLYAGIPFRAVFFTFLVAAVAVINPDELKTINWRAGVLYGIAALDKKG